MRVDPPCFIAGLARPVRTAARADSAPTHPYLSRTKADCFKLCGSAYASLPTLFRLLHTRECSRAANQAIQAHLIELLIARY